MALSLSLSLSLKLKMMRPLTKFLGGIRVSTMAWSIAEERHQTDSKVESPIVPGAEHRIQSLRTRHMPLLHQLHGY